MAISGPIVEWRPLPNRTVEIMLPNNRRVYHAIIEIGLCKYMRYLGPNEAMLKTDKQCYRISTESFEIKK